MSQEWDHYKLRMEILKEKYKKVMAKYLKN